MSDSSAFMSWTGNITASVYTRGLLTWSWNDIFLTSAAFLFAALYCHILESNFFLSTCYWLVFLLGLSSHYPPVPQFPNLAIRHIVNRELRGALALLRGCCRSISRLFTDTWPRRQHSAPFRFFDLPAELRIRIYEEVLGENPVMPLHRQAVNKSLIRSVQSLFLSRDIQYGLALVNRQMYGEFTNVACRSATFVFVCCHDREVSNWSVLPATLSSIRNLDLQIDVTSEMLGASSYRQAPPALPFRRELKASISEMKSLKRMSVHVRAIPDHLWNPVFIWLYTLEALKNCDIPQLRTITFGMGSWVPGANKAVLQDDGRWTWNCKEGHVLGDDPTEAMEIRQFCALIFQGCMTC